MKDFGWWAPLAPVPGYSTVLSDGTGHTFIPGYMNTDIEMVEWLSVYYDSNWLLA